MLHSSSCLYSPVYTACDLRDLIVKLLIYIAKHCTIILWVGITWDQIPISNL